MAEESTKLRPGENGTSTAMEEIRRLLLFPEQTQIRLLQERTEDPEFNAEMVSKVLPEAAALRSRQDHKLTTALLPTVEDAIALSVKKRPEILAGAIFPLLGPAIRKAIAAALSAMVNSMNRTLEESLSPRSLKWRFEAWRTGKPFAEVVLLRTLEYRVEQVLLIHRRNGLLLQHAMMTALPAPGADTISAMLTAIQDFVHDSFRVESNEEVEALQVGDLRVWVESGPQAILAAVIRGEAPSDLRTVMQETIETVHREYASELERFDGDSSPFNRCRDLLETLLTSRFQEKRSSSQRAFWIAAGVGTVLVVALLYRPLLQRHRWKSYLDDLRKQPGIVVVDADAGLGKHHLVGLRDPLSADPAALLRADRVNPQDVTAQWEPYASSYAGFVLTRAKNMLAPPDSVSLHVEDGVLYASGTAPKQWIEAAQKQFRSLGGIYRYDDAGLRQTVKLSFGAAVRQLESESVDFELGSARLSQEARRSLARVVQQAQQVLSEAAQAKQQASIHVIGEADQTGDARRNEDLSLQRANAVMSYLESAGLESKYFSVRGIGSRVESGGERAGEAMGTLRKVIFHVDVKDR